MTLFLGNRASKESRGGRGPPTDVEGNGSFRPLLQGAETDPSLDKAGLGRESWKREFPGNDIVAKKKGCAG